MTRASYPFLFYKRFRVIHKVAFVPCLSGLWMLKRKEDEKKVIFCSSHIDWINEVA